VNRDRRRLGGNPSGPPVTNTEASFDSPDRAPLLRCATCGAELAGLDPEDEPDGDAGLPICGECNRARNFDVL
jgi:hypothetical protein